jgi:Ni,Fe-hydrogenase I large subunit
MPRKHKYKATIMMVDATVYTSDVLEATVADDVNNEEVEVSLAETLIGQWGAAMTAHSAFYVGSGVLSGPGLGVGITAINPDRIQSMTVTSWVDEPEQQTAPAEEPTEAGAEPAAETTERWSGFKDPKEA